MLLQLLVDNMCNLVASWDDVYACCPASMPPEKLNELRNRSRVFKNVPDSNLMNFFWLEVCRRSKTFFLQSCCLFHPVRHHMPLPEFANVCVLLGGFGDGVRRGVEHAIHLFGGRCVAVHSSVTTPVTQQSACTREEVSLHCGCCLSYQHRPA